MPETLLVRARRLVRIDRDAGDGTASCRPARASAPSHELVVRPSQRLAALEGLRGYLALWVLVCHVMWSSGYDVNALSTLPQMVAKGRYAVEVFMIISGFVIFFLLDKQRENYTGFIIRRFFRIFPVFLVMFLVSIPGSLLVAWNTAHAPYLSSAHVHDLLQLIQSWWSNIEWHVPLHLVMLHGAVPPAVLEHTSMAFLAPAWSLSTEWQFYLVAPLAFAFAIRTRVRYRVGLCALCVCIFVVAKGASRVFPASDSQAALPSVLEFFFVGAVSYFLYKRNAENPFFDSAFPVFASLGIFLFILGGTSRIQLTPLVMWIIFLGLILEHPASVCSRTISPLFTRRLPQFLGRISYSLYLSHMLLMSVAQYCLLKVAPGLGQPLHFVLLLTLTVLISIAFSAALYRYLEAPATNWGKRLAARLATRPHQTAINLRSSPRRPLVCSLEIANRK